MSSIKDIQRVIDELRTGSVPDADCVALLHHPSPLVRANAIDAVAKRSTRNDKLLDELSGLKTADSANEARLMGNVKRV